MSRISKEQLLRLAQLASLNIHENDIEKRLEEMNHVLDYVAAMNEVAQTAPQTTSPTCVQTPMHTDEARPSLSMDQVMRNAPDHQDVFFRVPRMIGD